MPILRCRYCGGTVDKNAAKVGSGRACKKCIDKARVEQGFLCKECGWKPFPKLATPVEDQIKDHQRYHTQRKERFLQ